MVRIRNRLDQPLVVNLGRGRVRHILPGSVETIAEDEWRGTEVQNLVSRGVLERVAEGGPTETDTQTETESESETETPSKEQGKRPGRRGRRGKER